MKGEDKTKPGELPAFGKKKHDGRTRQGKPFIIHKKYDSIDQCETLGPELCKMIKAVLVNPDFPLELDNGQLFIRLELAFVVEENSLPPADHFEIGIDGSIKVVGEDVEEETNDKPEGEN